MTWGSGKYTAYHRYAGISYQEMQSGHHYPYTQKAFECPHSQNAYLFQFKSYQQRLQYDSVGTGGCCNEPVRPFDSKPQWTSKQNPPHPVDCGQKDPLSHCDQLGVSSLPTINIIPQASGDPQTIGQFLIRCPNLCAETEQLENAGVLDGRHGTYSFLGWSSPEEMLIQYDMNDTDLIHNAYVSGWQQQWYEELAICGDSSKGFGLGDDFENGNWDCCGIFGELSPPTGDFYHSGYDHNKWTSGHYYWTNTGWFKESWIIKTACPIATMEAWWIPTSGSTSFQFPWTTSPTMELVSQSPPSMLISGLFSGTVGSANASACCGGVIRVSGTDGCGNPIVDDIWNWPYWAEMLPSGTWSGASYTKVTEGSSDNWSLNNACIDLPDASWSVDVPLSYCLAQNWVSYDTSGISSGYPSSPATGHAVRHTGVFEYTATHTCSGCCGSGYFVTKKKNGCGYEFYENYYVSGASSRFENNSSCSGTFVGSRIKCALWSHDSGDEGVWNGYTPLITHTVCNGWEYSINPHTYGVVGTSSGCLSGNSSYDLCIRQQLSGCEAAIMNSGSQTIKDICSGIREDGSAFDLLCNVYSQNACDSTCCYYTKNNSGVGGGIESGTSGACVPVCLSYLYCGPDDMCCDDAWEYTSGSWSTNRLWGEAWIAGSKTTCCPNFDYIT